jgi:hypothetical protein
MPAISAEHFLVSTIWPPRRHGGNLKSLGSVLRRRALRFPSEFQGRFADVTMR